MTLPPPLSDVNNNLSGKITNNSGAAECIIRSYILNGYTFSNGVATAILDNITGYTLDNVITQLNASDTVAITATSVTASTRQIGIKCKKIADGSNFSGNAGTIRVIAVYKKSV